MIKNRLFYERFNYIKDLERYKNVEIASFLGINKSAVGFYANGVSLPLDDKIKSLAKLFNVTYDWLMGYSNDGIFATKEKDSTIINLSIEQLSSAKDIVKVVEHKIILVGDEVDEIIYSKQFNVIPEFFTIEGLYDKDNELKMVSTIEVISVLRSLKGEQYQKIMDECKNYIKDNSQLYIKRKNK